MFHKVRQRSKNDEYMGRTFKSMTLTGRQETSRRDNRPASSNSDQKERKPIEIDSRVSIYSVAFLADGKHVVSGGEEGKIRCWRVEDGQEVGTPIDVGNAVFNIAVSQDEKWVVSGTRSGSVTVWNAENHSKVTELKAHNDWVRAVDVSPDGTRIATGSEDETVCIWSLSSGERLYLKHTNTVVAVKFSPNGRLVATVTWNHAVRVYDSQNGDLLVEFSVQVSSALNQPLAWASDSKQLFALSRDTNINCLDVSTRTTLSKWTIHSDDNARCIALARDGTFIAVSANSSISFWDTATRKQIGSVIEHTHFIWVMAISTNYDLVIGGDKTATLRVLCDILPSRYFDNVCVSESSCEITSNHNLLR
jgi:WD40 repeat protein